MSKEQGIGSASPEAQVSRALGQAQFQVDRNKAREAMLQGDDSLMRQFLENHPVSGGSGMDALSDSIRPLGEPLTPEEAARQARLAQEMYGSEAEKFGESIRGIFDPWEIRAEAWSAVKDLEEGITTALPDVMVAELFARELKKTASNLELAQRDPEKARKKGLDRYGLVDGRMRRLRRLDAEDDFDNRQLTIDAKVTETFLQTARERNPGTQTNTIADAIEVLKPESMSPAVWKEHAVVDEGGGAVYLSKEAVGHLQRNFPVIKDLFREEVNVPAKFNPDQLKVIETEVRDIMDKMGVRIKLAFLFYKYRKASVTIKGLQDMLSDFAEVSPMDWKKDFNLEPTEKEGDGIGKEMDRFMRFSVVLAQLGQWMETDRLANNSSPEHLVMSAEEIASWKKDKNEKENVWLKKFRELWLVQPENYRQLCDIGVLNKVSFESGRNNHGMLTEDSKKKIDSGEIKLSAAEQNMLDLVERARLKLFNAPSNLVNVEKDVMDWVESMIIQSVPRDEVKEEDREAYNKKLKANMVDSKTALMLGRRAFRKMCYDSWFDNNADRGAYGAALSTPIADKLMHPYWTALYDARYIEGDSASKDRKHIPSYLLENPLRAKILTKGGVVEIEARIKHFLGSYLHMTLVNTDPKTRMRERASIGKEGTKSLHEMFLYEGVEISELPWEFVNGSMWTAMWEPFYYLTKEGGTQTSLDELPRDGMTLEFFQGLNASDYKGFTHFVLTGDYDGSIKRFMKEDKGAGKLVGEGMRFTDILYSFQIAYRRWLIGGRITHDYQNNPVEAYRKYGLWPPQHTADILNKDSLQQALGVILKEAHIIKGGADLRNVVVKEFETEKEWLHKKGIV